MIELYWHVLWRVLHNLKHFAHVVNILSLLCVVAVIVGVIVIDEPEFFIGIVHF